MSRERVPSRPQKASEPPRLNFFLSIYAAFKGSFYRLWFTVVSQNTKNWFTDISSI